LQGSNDKGEKMNGNVVGIDIGHSAVKVSTEAGHFQFPAMVMPALTIQDANESMRSERETVTVNNRKFFYGETALAHSKGDTIFGLNDTWVQSDHHEALVAASIQELMAREIPLDPNTLIMAGLPIKSFTESKSLIADQFKKLTQAEIRVVPQPFGPYFYAMLDNTGKQHPGKEITQDSYAVCDIGWFTTDIIVMRKGRYNQSCSGSAEGAHIAAKFLKTDLYQEKGLNTTLQACEEALRTNHITYRGKIDVSDYVKKAKSHLAEHVSDRIKDYLGPVVDEVSSIYIAGGGANLVHPTLRQTWSHAELVAEPRMSIAEGMRRMGLGIKMNR